MAEVPPTAEVQSPIEADPLPQGMPLKSSLRRLRKKVHHLRRKVENMEGELKKSKKNYAEASVEINPLRQAYKKDSMDYIKKKWNFEVKLEEI
ncbi:hypothetical protein COCNU_08G000450 [Cocos nucifera]|uniref:Uncharacterized protein n=1 Tax=Cocos nucifera TaxID=13894 RepID=A0A8K0IGD6_COCNU|nr:hypothetical protein COCNU_08G000450 [Cocos nucifera]